MLSEDDGNEELEEESSDRLVRRRVIGWMTIIRIIPPAGYAPMPRPIIVSDLTYAMILRSVPGLSLAARRVI